MKYVSKLTLHLGSGQHIEECIQKALLCNFERYQLLTRACTLSFRLFCYFVFQKSSVLRDRVNELEETAW